MEFPSEKKNQNLESQILFVQPKESITFAATTMGLTGFDSGSRWLVSTQCGRKWAL